MICPNCKIEGKGPRFLKRHPALCKKRQANKEYTHQVAQGTRAADYEELLQVTGKQKETVLQMIHSLKGGGGSV